MGEGWGGQAVSHCVSFSVRDSAALLDATSGPDVGDPYWAPPHSETFLDEVGRPPGMLRFALNTSPWNGAPVDPECRKAAEDAAKPCETLGHRVTDARPAYDYLPFREAQRGVVAANTRAFLMACAAAIGRSLQPDDVEPTTWEVAELARQYTAADYAGAMTRIHWGGRVVARFFEHHDIILTPNHARASAAVGRGVTGEP